MWFGHAVTIVRTSTAPSPALKVTILTMKSNPTIYVALTRFTFGTFRQMTIQPGKCRLAKVIAKFICKTCFFRQFCAIFIIDNYCIYFTSEIEDSRKLRVTYSASYEDLECDSSMKYTNIHKIIPETVQLGLNTIECVSTGVCFLDRVVVTDCSKRQKRSLSSSTAGVDVSLSCDPSSRKLCKN